jgi:predicted RNA methylase
MALQVPGHGELHFADLGSGVGKLALAAAAMFRSSTGIELAPERAAVATAALAKLGAVGARRCVAQTAQRRASPYAAAKQRRPT